MESNPLYKYLTQKQLKKEFCPEHKCITTAYLNLYALFIPTAHVNFSLQKYKEMVTNIERYVAKIIIIYYIYSSAFRDCTWANT